MDPQSAHTRPDWLAELAQGAADCLIADDLGPMGCHYCQSEGVWEISLFVSATEILGGARDGQRFPGCFHLDVQRLLALFGEVTEILWQAWPLGRADEDELGAHISVEGACSGQRICLRILAEAPRRFDVGRYADVYQKRYINLW
jgi:hypothetical protein